MKLLSFTKKGVETVGVLHGKMVIDLNLAPGSLSDFTPEKNGRLNMTSIIEGGENGIMEIRRIVEDVEARVEEGGKSKLTEKGVILNLEDVVFNAPIPRPRKNVICLGLNYADHVAEGFEMRKVKRDIPEDPIFFTKSPTSVMGPYGEIVYPSSSRMLDYEVELAVIIGKNGKNIPREEAYDHVYGYSILNDVTARDLQRKHNQWFKGKSCDTFAPMGPYLVTADEIDDPMELDIWLKVNEETRQSSNTRNMIFDIETIISVLSEDMTVEVGDIIATGTPSGVGMAHESGLLEIGDVVETGIEKIGIMRNKVTSTQ
jgi:2-keto-4-pentenoate hydratase/2-oxohepta-3-ene-1,7-dioic acid hydratase in catechol pathway